jgi:hypothetical protein
MAKLVPKNQKENPKVLKIKRKYGPIILGISLMLNVLMLSIILHKKG